MLDTLVCPKTFIEVLTPPPHVTLQLPQDPQGSQEAATAKIAQALDDKHIQNQGIVMCSDPYQD